MKVHNFQIEKRMELFNRWVKKRAREITISLNIFMMEVMIYT